MEKLAFRQLPWAARLAVGVAFLNAWVNIERLVINPSGLWKYMPYYRVGDACVWDLGVSLLVCAAIWRSSRGNAKEAA